MVISNKSLTWGNDQSFWLWKRTIEQRTGVRITADRENALVSLLTRRMDELGYEDVKEYFADSLDDAKGAGEWSLLVDSLLIKETSFFRHSPSLGYVENWVERNMATTSQQRRPIWLWSIGCSSGEEAYSLAIVVKQAMERRGGQAAFGIVATDISRKAIAQARRGIYAATKLTGISTAVKNKYFDQVDANNYRVKDSLRRHVCFLSSNVLDDKSPLVRRKMDLIYCQNMLVYFRRWQRREIVTKLTSHLQSDGHLLVGLGELGIWVPPGLERTVPRTVQAYKVRTAQKETAQPREEIITGLDSEQAIRRC